MRHLTRAAALLLVLYAGTAGAQASPAARVYKTQYVELSAKVARLVEDAPDRVATNRSAKTSTDLQAEVLALTSLLHRLGEEAERANFDGMGSSNASDKDLLLVSQACEANSFVLTALMNFALTNDRSFLALAREGRRLAESTERAM